MATATVTVAMAESQSSRELGAYAALIFCAFAWAAAFIAGKVVMAEITPMAAGGVRFLAAALILAPVAYHQRPRGEMGLLARPSIRRLGGLAVMVVCGGILYQWFFLLALQRTTATNTSLLIALNPVLTVLAAPLVGEALSGRRLVGIFLALLGAGTVITRGELFAGHIELNGGDLLAVAAAAAWAGFNLASRRVVTQYSSTFINCTVYSLGGLALLAMGAGEHPFEQFQNASASVWAGMFVLVVIASVISGHLFLHGVRTIGIGRATVFVYLAPALTAVLAAMLLGEPLFFSQLAGGLAVLAGVWQTQRTSG